MLDEVVVGKAEMVVAKETVVGAERRGVGGAEHAVTRGVDDGTLLLRIGSPEDEYEVVALLAEDADDSIGEHLPAAALMRTRIVGLHGERGVEEQHALVGPTGEVAVGRQGLAEVGLNLLEDVDQRGRHRHTRSHREAHAVGLPRLVVGVLTDDDHLDLMEGTMVEGVENLPRRGIDGGAGVLVAYEGGQLLKVGLVELRLEHLAP